MASILNAQARRFAINLYGIDRFVFNHAVDAFDHLVQGDGEGWKRKIADANEAMGYGRALTQKDKPTAVDQVIGVCITVYAEAHNVDMKSILPELKRRTGDPTIQ